MTAYKAEVAVQIVERWIIARLRHHTFFTLAALNKAMSELLTGLAVARSQQGLGLGERLLIDAIYRTVLVAQQISTIGLFVDPMAPEVIPFYQQYDFLQADAKDHSRLEMWLPIKTCIEIAESIKTIKSLEQN